VPFVHIRNVALHLLCGGVDDNHGNNHQTGDSFHDGNSLSLVGLVGATKAYQTEHAAVNDGDGELDTPILQSQNLTNLATADPDFDRVPGITRYAPA
jgi:hypothetical protein